MREEGPGTPCGIGRRARRTLPSRGLGPGDRVPEPDVVAHDGTRQRRTNDCSQLRVGDGRVLDRMWRRLGSDAAGPRMLHVPDERVRDDRGEVPDVVGDAAWWARPTAVRRRWGRLLMTRPWKWSL